MLYVIQDIDSDTDITTRHIISIHVYGVYDIYIFTATKIATSQKRDICMHQGHINDIMGCIIWSVYMATKNLSETEEATTTEGKQ